MLVVTAAGEGSTPRAQGRTRPDGTLPGGLPPAPAHGELSRDAGREYRARVPADPAGEPSLGAQESIQLCATGS